MNKKGIAAGGSGLIIVIMIAIVFVLILLSGGIKTIWDIGSFLAKVPTFIWVVLGVILLFRMIGGKR